MGRGAAASDGKARPDRRVDAFYVAGITQMRGGSDEIRAGCADGRPGADAADRQRILDAAERQHAAAAADAENEPGADDSDRDRSGRGLGGRNKASARKRGGGYDQASTCDLLHRKRLLSGPAPQRVGAPLAAIDRTALLLTRRRPFLGSQRTAPTRRAATDDAILLSWSRKRRRR